MTGSFGGGTSPREWVRPPKSIPKKIITYLDSCPQGQEGISAVAHLEDAPEPILCQIAYLQYFQVRRHGAEIELGHEDVIDNDWGLRRLVQGGGEQVAGALIEVLVSRERRPVEVESHRVGVCLGIVRHRRRPLR